MMAVIRSERGDGGVANNAADGDDDAAVLAGAPRRLSRAELEALLAKRVQQMQAGGSDDAPADQFRVYTYIIGQFERGDRPLRLMVQASAGTGKSRRAAMDRYPLLTNVNRSGAAMSSARRDATVAAASC